jgi:hypothetical protein
MQPGVTCLVYPLEAIMATDNFARFLQECLVVEEDTEEGLDLDTLYGLYISWCRLENLERIPERAFGSMLRRHHLHWGRYEGNWVLVGLRMVGPAARDYVLSGSAPMRSIGAPEFLEVPNAVA